MFPGPQPIVPSPLNQVFVVATPRLQLFGGARILVADGTPLQGRAAHRRRLAVMALLAAARGRPIGRERVVALLWPDANPADGRHSLVESLSVIRRELGMDPFTCVGDEVALDPDLLPSDLNAFWQAAAARDAEAASALYAGPFLDGFAVRDASEFDRWAEETRAVLAAEFARVLEEDAEECERRGNYEGAVRAWRRLAAHERYSTRAALRLAQALERTGDAAAAAQHLSVHECLLREELEIAAPPELVDARERLRRGAPRVDDRTSPLVELAAAQLADAPALPEAETVSELVRHSDDAHLAPAPRETTVWLAAPAAPDRLRAERPDLAARASTQLRQLARHAAEHAGGTVEGVVGDAVLARFVDPRGAVASAVALMRRWEVWRARENVSVQLVAGIDRGVLETAGARAPDQATLRASVLCSRAEPGSILTTSAVAREAGAMAGVSATPAGAAGLPGDTGPEPLVALTPVPRRRTEARPAPAGLWSPAQWRRRVGFVVGAIATAVFVAAWVVGSRPTTTLAGSTGARPEQRARIAILGCEVAPGADSLRTLCDGALDLTAMALSRVPSVDVVRPWSGDQARPFWPAGSAMDSLARSMGGFLVLSARLERTADGDRQILFLADPLAGGRLVAADTLQNAGGVERPDEYLSGRMAVLLRRWLGTRAIPEPQHTTRSSAAARWFAQARALRFAVADSAMSGDPLGAELGRRDLSWADSLLMRAERGDPRWIDPVVERGWVAVLQGRISPLADRTRLWRRALSHAERAVALRSDDPAALELRGRVRWLLTELSANADSGDQLIEGALADLDRARRLDERRASALYALSELQYYQGEFAASMHTARQAYRAEPLLVGGDRWLLEREFRSVLSMGRLDLAQVYCLRGGRDYPHDFRWEECRLLLAARGAGSPDTAAAAAVRRRLEAGIPPETADSVGLNYQPIHWQVQYAAVLARAGATARAHQELARAAERARTPQARNGGETQANDNQVSFRFDEAQVLLLLGDRAGARRALDDVSERLPFHRGFIRNEAIFRELFSDYPSPAQR